MQSGTKSTEINAVQMDTVSPHQNATWRSRLELVATLLLISLTLTLGWFTLSDRLRPAAKRGGTSERMPESAVVNVADASIRGDRSARVAVVLFSDFECSYCASAAQILVPQLDREYIKTKKVFLVWRHYPLSIHPSARGASEAVECAGRQGRFWDLHDWAFNHQKELRPPHLRGAAEGLGADIQAFDACISDPRTKSKIDGDLALGKDLDVTGTPTWFVGSATPGGRVKLIQRIGGAGSFEVLKRAIEGVLGSTKSGN
jgi:protein-disulfide isomerase